MSWFLIIAVLAATASLGQGATIWDEDLANEEISESLSIGDSIGTLLATDDQDPQKTYLYSIRDITSSPDAFDYVQVDAQSGNVTVKAELDYETFVSMKAQWEADSVRSREVTIYIRNEYDNDPVFWGEPYSEEISEDASIGDSVIQVNATDGDVNDDITFTLDDGTGCEMNAFRVDGNSGELFVNQTLDYASIVQYRVCVNATDNGGFSDSTVVVISIRDAQNQPPVFVGQPYDRTIPEDTQVGDVVLRVAANDGDLGVNPRNIIIYRLIENATGTFSVDESNGDIKVEKILDRETDPITQLFTLTVQAIEDDDNQPFEQRNSNTSIYVRLSDVDDNIPTFNPEGPVNATIPEHSPTGTQIDFGLEAFDLDTGEAGEITLSLEDDNDVFYLASQTIFNSGVVDVRVNISKALDFERIQRVIFQIRAESTDGTDFSVITAIVELTDINDNTPEFTQPQYDVDIQENADEGTFVIQIEATDADEDAELTYDLLGLNNDWFNIDFDTGNINVSAAADFNAELLSVYFLTCLVSDGERVSTSLLIVTITDVNDEEPEFQFERYIDTISEYNMEDLEEEELYILEVVATDADIDISNRMLEYSIESGNKEGKFGINSTTGVIFRQLSIDLETENATYNLVVMATDSGTPPLSGTTNVIINIEDVNDNDPMFLTDTYNAEVAEDAEFGAVVANVTAVDADVSSLAVLYTIQGATPFLIDQDGIITLSGNLDYEVKMTYNLTVTATDREDTSRKDSCLVLIEILDVNDEIPEFETPSPSSIEVNESASFCGSLNGPDDCKVLIILEASDPDTNANLSYSISEVKGYDENNREVAGDFLDQFGVESELGEVYVQKELDRETVQRFDVTVDVDDMNAEDNIDSQSQSDSAELLITILDVNDNAPGFTDRFPESTTISETAEPGSSVAIIVATDIDEPDTVNSEVRYSMTNLNGTDFFKIDDETGVVILNTSSTDALIPGDYVLRVIAFDLGIPRLETEPRDFHLIVTDYNDEAPVFVQPVQGETVYVEEHYIGYVITAMATDGDLGDNAVVTFSFDTGLGATDDWKFFTIDNITGEINITSKTDREMKEIYILGIVGKNAKSDPIRESQVTFYIEVNDADDNEPAYWGKRTGSVGPLLPPEPTELQVQENLNEGTFVGVVPKAVDLDSDLYNQIYYFLVSGTNEDYFNLEKVSGNLTLLNTIDRELRPDFSLIIRADSDPDYVPDENVIYDPLTNDTLVRVTVIVSDVNDSPPKFEYERYTAGVLFSTAFGVEVITVTAIDPDLGSNAIVEYSITSQTSYKINADGTVDTEEVFVFGINNFGQVVNSITFQKSTDDYYIVELLATDRSGNFSDTTILSVYLMTETDQVSVIIADEPTNVKETQDEFASLLEEIMEVEGGYSEVSVTIDSTAYELDSNGIGIANRTEMLLHVVDDATNTVIEPSVVQKVIDSASGYTGELVAYHVIEVEYKTKQIEADVLTTLQTFSFSLAFVMFVILIILLLAFYFSVTSYRRKLRAATITFGSGDNRKEAPLPNTNMYADNKNPVFNLNDPDIKEPLSNAEESGKEADESPLPREEEDQEAEMSFDVEGVYDEIESGNGQGDNKLLDDLLQNFEKQRGSVNLGYDQGQEEKNLYMSEV